MVEKKCQSNAKTSLCLPQRPLGHLRFLQNRDAPVGMILPYLDDDELIRKIEPQSPPPSKRYEALLKGHEAGCRLYVAMAPTPPTLTLDDFKRYLEKILTVNPEVIFWEPINARGSNGKRMTAAGLDFAHSIMTRKSWAECFNKQWEYIEEAAKDARCEDRLHIWPDPELRGYVDEAKLEHWLYKPTVEKWDSLTALRTKGKSSSTKDKNYSNAYKSR